MRVLLTGAAGMLGRAVQATAPSVVHVQTLTHNELDVTDARLVEEAVQQVRPAWVINCAAYTKVDDAETEPAAAYAVNAAGAMHLAITCRRLAARLLHVSTDYVFDGQADRPYPEDAPTRPLNVYGRSKLAGELAVRDILPEAHLIVRTQWLFGMGGSNFVATILRLAEQRPVLRVADDQRGRPTYAADLGTALWVLLAREARGTYHVCNDGVATWFELARAATAATGLQARIEPCSTAEMRRPAARPAFSVLDCTKFRKLAGAPLRPWFEAVREFVGEAVRQRLPAEQQDRHIISKPKG